MKRYRLYKRKKGGCYYAEDIETGKQQSLHTKDKDAALRLILHLGEAVIQPCINLQIAKGYLAAVDPELTKRTWKAVMDQVEKCGCEATRKRAQWATKCPHFDRIRNKPIVETTSQDFLAVLEVGGTSVNHFLRRYHNLALGLGWLPWPILTKKFWPQIRHKKKRAITLEEHQRIVAREGNKERRLFYEMLWETGASQTDAATMNQENIDWKRGVITIKRKKLDHLDTEPAQITIGPRLTALLKELPSEGWLFPYLRTVDCKHRGTEFQQRCEGLGIYGVSLHSYRYAWAQRAAEAGMPERFAQSVLGHASKAVHRGYAKGARMKLPALEIYEQQMAQKIVPMTSPVQVPELAPQMAQV
jgi:integrase